MGDQKVEHNSEQNVFLATKLFIPRSHSKQVLRPALIEKLNAFSTYKMTLVSAPAGFGKTTIISQWISQLELPVAWVSLDERDNDPYIFLQYVIAAMQSVDAELGVAARQALHTAKKQTLTGILIPLLNDIASRREQLCIVLDDYHCITSHEVHEILSYMLEHHPPQLHIVLSTRADPPLSLARMRARNNLLELRIGELCFTRKNIASFFHDIMALPLSDEQITTLEHRTEGWAAGLQLAAISLQGCENTQDFITAFSGDNRYIVDYLVEEVLQKQTEETFNFLLGTSILQQFSSDLCDHVLQTDDSRAILNSLEQQNLFIIPLDNQRKWFRYHHLFADLLRQRLQQQNSDSIAQLLLRASGWHEKKGYIHSAIDYAISAEDYRAAAVLLERVSADDWRHDKRRKLSNWLEKLPIQYIHEHPDLSLFYIWVLMDDNRQEEAENSLAVIERYLEDQKRGSGNDPLSKGRLAELGGKVGVLRALLETAHGDAQCIIDFANEALQHLPAHSYTWRANGYLALGIAYSINGELKPAVDAYQHSMEISKIAGYLDLYFRGGIWLVARLTYAAQLDQATQVCNEMFEVVEKSRLEQSLYGTGVFLSWGNVLYELNKLDQAYEYIEKDYQVIGAALDIRHKAWCYCCMMKVLAARNDREGIDSIIEEVEEFEATYELPFTFKLLTGSWKAKLWFQQNNIDKVGRWLEEHELAYSDEIVAYRDLGHVILARYLLNQGKVTETIELLKKLIVNLKKLGRTLLLIEAFLLQAQALEKVGDREEAAQAVLQALRLGEKGKCVRVFLSEGEPVAKLLEYLMELKLELPRTFVKKLLAEFNIDQALESEKERTPEILSERELEVLRYIASGLSNKKIMAKLYISMSTVKTHLRNIYSKLDAHSRTEAIAKANQLNLL